ncbi:hypothetical protein [Pararhizobium qamdonense]|uniref:hypothetical protein n=1 Tax=Pararhizobium qamdonense TaxID=3031126 RepID=UPI0023E255D3|nr:hypothetical protein [Pararhizobium qamdonense]
MNPDEYLTQSREQHAASVKQTAFAVTQDAGTTPDQHASDMKLAQSLALPTSLTSQFRDTFAQKMMAKRNETILSANPRLATWMQDKDNAKLASDDLTALSGWEQFAKGALSGQVIEAGKGIPGGAVSATGTALEGAGQLLTPVDPAVRMPMATRIVMANQRSPEEIAALRKEIFKQGEINPQVAQSVLSDVLSGNMSADEAYQSLEPLFEPALKAASQALQRGGEKTQDYGATILPAAPGMEESFGREIGSGLGSMLALLGVGVVTGPAGAATVGGAMGAGEAAGNARKAGQDEDTQTIAALYGIAPGMTDAIPIERLLGNPVVKGAFASFLRSVGKQTALEGGQEAVQQLMQNAIASSLYAPDKDMLDDVMSSFATGGAVGAIVEAGRIAFQAALPGRVRGLSVKAQQAEQTKAAVDQLGDMAVNSKLRQRMDGSFLDFVDKATEGTPVQDVYVPAEKLNELFQSFRYNPEEFLTELPGVDFAEWETALATGGDLKIPTAVYAAKLAGGEMDAVLRENMKFDPDGMTFSEARDFNDRAEEIQMEAFEQSEAARVADEASRQVDQQEYDDVVSRLRTAGRATDVAKFEAMPLVAMRRTMAERSGLSQEEFAAKYPLPEIRGAVPEGMKTKNVDELTRQLAELRSYVAKPEKNGPSLLEAISDYGGINDVGGELKARDAAVIKRGRGKKNLKLARGGLIDGVKDMFGASGGKKHGIDDVAQAMIEAGYLQDNPAAIAYRHAIETGGELPDIGRGLLEAIDEELRGNVQYSGNREIDPKASWADDTVSYLDSLGVSLDDSDYVIRAAIAKGQDAEGQKYGQPAQTGRFSFNRTYEQANRGSIQLPTNGAANSPVIISLFESADLSTFNHEAGHYFLNILQDMATPPGVSQEIVDMYGSVKGWWRDNAADVARDAKQVTGVEVSAADVVAMLDNGTSGDTVVDQAIDTGLHEQFARGFEAYLMEGKAPSIELRSAFERFAQWLVRLYRSIKALDVNITPEIQSVFDRLVATDAEIEAARSDVSDEMLFAAAEAAGVSPDDYRQLVKLHEQSIEAATQKLRKEVMGPIQRETEKAYKVEKAKVRDEVEGQINGMPVYRAWEWMGNRRWFGDADPTDMPDMRFDRGMLVDRYGEGVLKTLPRGKFTLYANEGGMDPDEVAGWFGFKSGDDLVKALEQATPRKDAIAAETERVMLERHGDVLKDGQIEERAIEAVHNDKRGQFLAAELKILKARAGDTSPDMTMSQAREAARQTINKMQVRDAVSSNRFLTAERKAANEAVKLARLVERENLWSRQKRRDVQSAVRSGSLDSTNAATVRANVSTDRYNDAVERLVEQKRRQLLNHMLYSESVAVAEEIEKAERFVSRLGKKSTRDNLAGDYLEAIDELLERYDFRKLSVKAEQRKGSLLNYVARMTAEGRENELSIPDAVLNDAKRRPYRRLSVDELRGVVDTLKNIEHTARLKQKLKDAKRERDLDAVVGDILAEFEANVKGDAPSRAKSGRGGVKPGFRSYLNIVKTADTILREIDGFKDGAAYRHIKAPIDEAMNDLTIKRREAGEQFEQLYSVYTAAERRAMTTLMSVPELNGQFSKWDLISLAFNVGNEGNYQRLTDERVKGHFTTAQIELALLQLEQRDWEFVQSAWDLIGGYWPEIEAREKRVTGVAPEKIAPREVQTKFGKFKGGYFPLKYDAEISSLSRDDDLKDLATAMAGGRYGKAQTRNGHTKERAQSSGRPVLIDIGVLHGHVNQVVHDLALSETVANSWRILQNDEVKSAFLDRGLKSDFDSLEVWVQDVAAGEIRGSDFMNRWARKMKSGFTVSKLAFNLTTVLLQPTGIAQSMVVVGEKNLLLGMTDVFRRPLSGPGSAASQIIGKSAFMRERETTFNKDIYDLLGDTKTGPSQNRVSQFTSDILAPWGFWLMQKAQFYTVDMPTWLAGFRQATDEGKSEADAIAHADRIVARAAASGNFSDRSPIERGSLSRDVRQNDVVRLFTALGSYMFAKFNVAYERTQQTQFADPRQVLSWTTDMVMLFTVEAVLAGLVRGQLPWGDDDDDDKDGWAEYLAKQTALSITATLPFIRDLASGVQGFSGGGAYGSIMDTMARPIYQASQGDVDKAFVRSVVDAGGLFLHAPSTQINRFIDAAWRQSEGDDVSPIEYIMGKSK